MKNLCKKALYGLLFAAVMQSSFSQPSDGIVAYYPFNGNAYDVTGNGRNAVVSNATLTSDRLGNANQAYQFNGSNCLIYLPNNLMQGNTAFSISCWVKVNGNNFAPTVDYGQTLIDFRGQYQIALSYYETDHPTYPNAFGFYIYSSPNARQIFTSNNFVQFGTWYHLLANYGNNTMEFYINGVLIGSLTQTPPGAVNGYNNTIGKDYNVGLNRSWLYGAMDEIIVYKRSLTLSEIQTIYNLGLTQKDLPLLYGPVNYSYDAMGNRIGRNVIRLKSSAFIATARDSSGIQIHDSIASEELYEKNNKDFNIKILPNPTRGELQVHITNFDFSKRSAIYVYNTAAKLVAQKSPASEYNFIDLLKYPNGMYLMKIVLGDKTSEWKILKE